jgi:hypothetical protein
MASSIIPVSTAARAGVERNAVPSRKMETANRNAPQKGNTKVFTLNSFSESPSFPFTAELWAPGNEKKGKAGHALAMTGLWVTAWFWFELDSVLRTRI